MEIKASVQGDPDIEQFTMIFYYDAYDESIFLASARQIKDRFLNNMRLSIIQILEPFVACIVLSLNKGNAVDQIQNHIPNILPSHRVMTGVPASLMGRPLRLLQTMQVLSPPPPPPITILPMITATVVITTIMPRQSPPHHPSTPTNIFSLSQNRYRGLSCND